MVYKHNITALLVKFLMKNLFSFIEDFKECSLFVCVSYGQYFTNSIDFLLQNVV